MAFLGRWARGKEPVGPCPCSPEPLTTKAFADRISLLPETVFLMSESWGATEPVIFDVKLPGTLRSYLRNGTGRSGEASVVGLRRPCNSFGEGRSGLQSPLESFEALAAGEDERAVGCLARQSGFSESVCTKCSASQVNV